MCARSASAGWLHLVEQVQEGTEKLKNIKLKKHISLKKKCQVYSAVVFLERWLLQMMRGERRKCVVGGKKAWEGSTEEIPTEIHSQEN